MADAFAHLHIVLLCDEDGSRLWPLVGEGAPACLAPAGMGHDTSLLVEAVGRVRGLTEHPIHVITSKRFAAVIEDQILSHPALADCDMDMLVQPLSRGSAFAVALMAARIRMQDPSAVVAVFPANQRIEADDRWPHLMHRAYLAAMQDKVAVIGSKQKRPCQRYTFVRPGAQLEDVEETFEVRQFSVDAPAVVAHRAQREGALWYTGIVFARAAVLMGEMAYAGQYGRSAESRGANRIAETAHFFANLGVSDLLKKEAEEVVSLMPDVSLESSVLAVSGKLVVLAATFEIETLDSLESLAGSSEPDTHGNRSFGRCVVRNAKNTTVYSQEGKRDIVLLGMQDCLVVDAGDALLVAHKDHLDEVSGLFE